MTERQRQMIEGYIPNPRDPELGDDDFYILDPYDRVQKVYITDINPGRMNEGVRYGVRYSSTGKKYGGSDYGNTYMSQLYDNKEDCRNQTHMLFEGWEELRELQRKENR